MTQLPEIFLILMNIRMEMQLGRSVQNSLTEVLSRHHGEYAKSMKIWLHWHQQGEKLQNIIQRNPTLIKTTARKALIQVLDKGLQGSPIDQQLAELEKEFEFIIVNQFERTLQVLPYKLMIPLTVFLLPAVILLIVGPLWYAMKSAL